MTPSESSIFDVRGLRYHMRRWSRPGRPKLLLLHGWMDVSASFQFMVDEFSCQWDIYAPDWRGFGLTQWGPGDHYLFADYLADLDLLARRIDPEGKMSIVGHSMGANVAMLYAGIRPRKLHRLVVLEGFGGQRCVAEQAPEHYAEWFDALQERPGLRSYGGFGLLADRLQAQNRRLTRNRAEFLAQHWGMENEAGRVVLRADPAHKIVSAMLHRTEETLACWARITAPTLLLDGGESGGAERLGLDEAEKSRRRSFLRNARRIEVPDAGHMLHHDRPDEVAKLVEAFLTGS
jgi:pimeloyl-ACP methyl ester carboxylesterase